MGLSKKNSSIARNIILDYYENPKLKIENHETLENYILFENKSDSCVDNITVMIKMNDNIVEDAKYFGIGCAISMASTEIMLNKIIGKNLVEIEKILNYYNDLLKGIEHNDSEEILEDLIVFYNIHNQQNRIRCATIASYSIQEILAKIKKL